jgi:hypothetical protein
MVISKMLNSSLLTRESAEAISVLTAAFDVKRLRRVITDLCECDDIGFLRECCKSRDAFFVNSEC